MLRTYRACNPTVGFLKYEFNNKLLCGVTFLRTMTGPTVVLKTDTNKEPKK